MSDVRRRRVVVESPYKPVGVDKETQPEVWASMLRRNILYARAAYRYCLAQGVAPFASHLNYTQPGVLNDEDDSERWQGIEAGLELVRDFEESWFFIDFGESTGMDYGRRNARAAGRRCRNIKLGPDWKEKWLGSTKDEVWG